MLQEEKSLAIEIKPPKRQQNTVGAIVEIPVHEQFFCYAQIIPFSQMAFFDFRSRTTPNDLSIFNSLPILFKLCVYNNVVASGRWMKIGKQPIREDCKTAVQKFLFHGYASPEKQWELYIVDNDGWRIIPGTKDQAKGLERCAVWDYWHVEDRLYDYYLGNKCDWLKEQYELFPDIDPITLKPL